MQEELNNKIYLKDNFKEEKYKDIYDYSKFTNLEDFELDNEIKDKFTPIAKKLNLSQESVDMLLDIALEMSMKQKAIYEKDENARQNELIAKYSKLFDNDKEIPSSNSKQIQEYMSVANCAFCEFCSKELKEILNKTGLVYHPEMIKMFHKIGTLAQDDELIFNGKPSVEELTPAQILYGTHD